MKFLENKFFQFLVFVLMIVIIGYFISTISQTMKTSSNDVISVTGTGEVYVTPDIGLIDVSVKTQDMDVSAAANENSEKMNAIIEYLKNNNVEEKDIKTIGFNIYPVYSYDRSGTRHLDGYEVNQTLEVKIRDLAKVGDIISNATSLGANDISSLSFTVDNDDQAKEEAKNLAIADARAKAKNLENALGIRLEKIVNFSEGTYPFPLYDNAYGIGGGAAMKVESSVVPSIQTGQNKITSTVTITYSIR